MTVTPDPAVPDPHTSPRTPPSEAPVIFRPRQLRRTVWVFSVVLVVGSAAGWIWLPPDMRATFNPAQQGTLLLLVAGLLFVLLALGASLVRADADGLTLRNGLRTHRVPWGDVHKILLRQGDPWALVLIKPTDRPFEVDLDAEKRQIMGIQATDGAAAQQAVAELRRRLQAYRANGQDQP